MFETFLRTVVGRLLFILFLIVCVPFFLLFLMTPRRWLFRSRFLFRCEDIFHRVVLAISWVPISYTGKENLPDQPAVFVANHQSSFDVPLMGHLMRGFPHVWLALAELRNSLFLRFVLPKVSMLVDLSSPAKGVRTLREAIAFLQEYPVHVIIFPEGGRFTDNTVHPFYSGFALIARKTSRPVIPVLIKGVNKVYPPGSFLVYEYPISVTIGQPMIIGEQESDNDFKDRVYQWFVQQNQDKREG